MFEGVLSTILNTTVGKFLKNVTPDQLKIGLSGVLELKDVEIKGESLDFLELPISIKLGRIGLLRIELSLFSPLKVTVSDVYAVIGLASDKEIDPEQLNADLLQAKLSSLLNWELLHFPEKEVEEDKGKLMKMVDKLIDHITVSVSRVHAVFEETGINAGAIIESAEVYPVDENDRKLTEFGDSSVVARRKIEVKNVGVYLNIDPQETARGAMARQLGRDGLKTENLYGTSDSKASSLTEYNKRKEKGEIYNQMTIQPEHSKVGFPPVNFDFCASIWDNIYDPKWSYILPPVSIKAYFNMWKGTMEHLQSLNPPRPSMEAIVNITEIGLAIQQQQYQGIMTIVALLSNNPSAVALLQLEQQQDIRERVERDEITSAEQERLISKGIDYVQLYKRNFQGYPILKDKEQEVLKSIEQEHTLSQILSWRSVALKVVQLEYQQDTKPFWRQKESSGFLSGWFGNKPKTPVKTLDINTIREMVKDPVELQHQEESKAMKNVQAHYTNIAISASLEAATINVLSPTREKMLSLGVFDLKTDVKLHPHAKAITASIDRLEAIDHLTVDAIHRSFLSKSSHVDKATPFVSAAVVLGDSSLHPETGYDMSVKAKVTGVDVIVNIPLLLSLVKFFEPPKYATIASAAKNDVMKQFTAMRSSMQSNAVTALENRGRNFIDLAVEAPTVIIPNNVTDANSHLLVCYLGQIFVNSTPPPLDVVAKQKVLLAQAQKDPKVLLNLTREEQKDKFYDTFDISLKQLCVYIGDKSRLHAPRDDVYLVKPMDLDVAISLSALASAMRSDDDDDNKDGDAKGKSTSTSSTSSSSSKALVKKPVISAKKIDINIPQVLVDVSLPAIDVQISPLKLARVLRLAKALLRALKISNEESEQESSTVEIEEILDARFYEEQAEKQELIAAKILEKANVASPSKVKPDRSLTESTPDDEVNPYDTSLVVSARIGRVSCSITNDLVPLFPVAVVFISIEGMYCSLAMRPHDMDLALVLKTFYIEDKLNQYSGPYRFLLMGESRPLISFHSNEDVSYHMNRMLTHAFDYNTSFQQEIATSPSRLLSSPSEADSAPSKDIDHKPIQHVDITAKKMSTTSVIDSAFLSCHVSLPKRQSPVYALVDTLATAHFGRVSININRESLPALMMFFAKQMLPNPGIINVEDATQGPADLDVMNFWTNTYTEDDDDDDDGDDEDDHIGDATNDGSGIPLPTDEHVENEDLLKSGLDDDTNGNPHGGNTGDYYNNLNAQNMTATGFDVHRTHQLIHGSPLPEPKKGTSTSVGGDDAIHVYIHNLISIDTHQFNLHFYGLVPHSTPAFPQVMEQNPDYKRLIAMFEFDEGELIVAEGEKEERVRQEFRNERIRLVNKLLQHYTQQLEGYAQKYEQQTITSVELLHLHRYVNTKTLVQLSRLEQRLAVLDKHSGYLSEKLAVREKKQDLEALLRFRRQRLLDLRKKERRVAQYNRLGQVSSLVCNETDRVGVFCLANNFSGEALSLHSAIEQGHIKLKPKANADPTKNPIYDAETNDVVAPLFNYKDIDYELSDGVELVTSPSSTKSHKTSKSTSDSPVVRVVPLSVLARVSFIGITITVASQNVPLLDVSISALKLGFAQHVHGMSVKLIVGQFSIRNLATIIGKSSAKTNTQSSVTGTFIEMVLAHQTARTAAQQEAHEKLLRKTTTSPKSQKSTTSIAEEDSDIDSSGTKNDLDTGLASSLLLSQICDIRQYINTNYKRENVSAPYGIRGPQLMRYRKLTENRMNYAVSYPDVLYTSSQGVNNPALGKLLAPPKALNITPLDEPQEFAASPSSGSLIDITMFMRNPLPIIYDDTDEYDYYSLVPVNNLQGLGAIAHGLHGDSSSSSTGSSHPGIAINRDQPTSPSIPISPQKEEQFRTKAKKVTTPAKTPKQPTVDDLLRTSLLQRRGSINNSIVLAPVRDDGTVDASQVTSPVITELDYNLPVAASYEQDPSLYPSTTQQPSTPASNASMLTPFIRLGDTISVKGRITGLRIVVCYRLVDGLLKYIEGLDKAIAIIMKENAVTMIPKSKARLAREHGRSLREESIQTRISLRDSMSNQKSSRQSNDDNDNGDDITTSPQQQQQSQQQGSDGQQQQQQPESKTQVMNNINNATKPEEPRAFPLLFNLDIQLIDLNLCIPVSSTSPEMVSLQLSLLSVTSETAIADDPIHSEGTSFFATAGHDVAPTAPADSLAHLKSQFYEAATRRPSLLRSGSRSTSSSFTPSLTARRLRVSSLLDDDDLFFDPEEYQGPGSSTAASLEAQTYMSVSTPMPDNLYMLPQDFAVDDSKEKHGIGAPSQTYEYRSVAVNFAVVVRGLSISTLLYINTKEGLREQSAAPKIDNILNGCGGVASSSSSSSSTQSGENDTNTNDSETKTSPSTQSESATSYRQRGAANKTILTMIDLLRVSDVNILATHHVYLPIVYVNTPPVTSLAATTPAVAPDYILFHTAHTFYPPKPLPDWDVTLHLDNIACVASQPQLSLILAMLSNHSYFPGNLNEKSPFTFPSFAPATASSSKDVHSIRYYCPEAHSMSISLLRKALEKLDKLAGAGAGAFDSNDARQALLYLQSAKINNIPMGVGSAASGHGPSGRRGTVTSKGVIPPIVAGSRISMLQSRYSSRRTATKESVNPWEDEDDPQQAIDLLEKQHQARLEEPKKKGMSVNVRLDITQCSLQLLVAPHEQESASITVLVTTRVRFTMKEDGSIAVVAGLRDICVVNATVSTNSALLLRDHLGGLPVSHAIVKPFSCLANFSMIPQQFDSQGIIHNLPRLYKQRDPLPQQKHRQLNKSISTHSMNVSCIVTDLDMKVSYTDYELIMSILGTLSQPQDMEDFSLESFTAGGSALVNAATPPPSEEELQRNLHALSMASLLAASDGTVLHSMGDMKVTFMMNKLNLLLVNDTPGIPVPFLLAEVSNVSANVTSFGHQRTVDLDSSVHIKFHNGTLVSWEPLLEPCRFLIGVSQSVTQPMMINVKSIGPINLNVTRGMMEGLSQSLSLISSAQKAQQKRIQRQLLTLSEEGDDADSDNYDDDNGNGDDQPDIALGGKDVKCYTYDKSFAQQLIHKRKNDGSKNFSFFKLENNTEFDLFYAFGAYNQNMSISDQLGDSNDDDANDTTTNNDASQDGDIHKTIKKLQEEAINDVLTTSQSIDQIRSTATSLSNYVQSLKYGGYLADTPFATLYKEKGALSSMKVDNSEIFLTKKTTAGSGHRTSQSFVDVNKDEVEQGIRDEEAKNSGESPAVEDDDQNVAIEMDTSDASNAAITTLPAVPSGQLTKQQKKRIFQLSLWYTVAMLRAEQVEHDADESHTSSTTTTTNSSKKVRTSPRRNTNTQHLPTHSHCPLFIQSTSEGSDTGGSHGTINDLLVTQQRQAISMLKATSLTTSISSALMASNASHSFAHANVLSTLPKLNEKASKKLLSIQIDGYLPLHNIQCESIGCRAYALTPGPCLNAPSITGLSKETIDIQRPEKMNILVDVSVVQGVKCVSIRSARAVVNLTDVILEVNGDVVYPGETFYLPLSVSQPTLSIRPLYVKSGKSGDVSSELTSTGFSRTMQSVTQQNDITSISSLYKKSYPLAIDSLTNGCFITCDPYGLNTDAQSSSDTHLPQFMTLIQRWRLNGCTFWALCLPFAITNLLSERCVVSLSTKSRTTQGKGKKSSVIVNNDGCDFNVDLAPTHTVRAYHSLPQYAKVPDGLVGPDKTTSPDTGSDEYSKHATYNDVYMNVSIPSLNIKSIDPINLSRAVACKQGTQSVQFVCVNEETQRELVIHGEINLGYLLCNEKTTNKMSIPSISTSVLQFQQSFAEQSTSAMVSRLLMTGQSSRAPLLSVGSGVHSSPAVANAAVKLVLFTPYWLYDASFLGVVLAAGKKLSSMDALTSTQLIDEPTDVASHSQEQLTLTKIRLAALTDSLNNKTLDDHTRAIAIATRWNNKFVGQGADGSSSGNASDGATSQESILSRIEENCFTKAVMFSTKELAVQRAVIRLTGSDTNKRTKQLEHVFISETSEPFPLNAVGSVTLPLKGLESHQLMISGRKDKIMYNIAIQIQSGQGLFKRTKQVFFSPAYVMVNKLPLPIMLRQHCVEDLATLRTQSSATINLDEEEEQRSEAMQTVGWLVGNNMSNTPVNDAEDNMLELEAKYHSTACFYDRTQRYIRPDNVETWHWAHSKEKQLVSFKMMTEFDPLTAPIEKACDQIHDLALDEIREDALEQHNLSTIDHCDDIVEGDDGDENAQNLIKDIDEKQEALKQTVNNLKSLNNIALMSSDSTFASQFDGHSVISAVPAPKKIQKQPSSAATTATTTTTTTTVSKAVPERPLQPWDEGVWGWSGYLDISKIGDHTIIVRNPVTHRAFFVKVRVVLTSPAFRGPGNTTTVIFESQDLVFPKYRIENNTSSDTFRFAQKGCHEWTTLAPYESAVYTYDQPSLESIIELNAISGTSTIHKELTIDVLGDKGHITIPGHDNNELFTSTIPGTPTRLMTEHYDNLVKDGVVGGLAIDEQTPRSKSSKCTKGQKGDELADHELVQYHQQGGVNPLLSTQSNRQTHKVYISVQAEGPTRVLVLSDYPTTNNDIDLVTLQLLSHQDTLEEINKIYDSYNIGLRGQESGRAYLRNYHRMKKSEERKAAFDQRSDEEIDQDLNAKILALDGPYAPSLCDKSLLIRAQEHVSEYKFDQCQYITAFHNPSKRLLAANHFGFIEQFNNDPIRQLSTIFPGIDIYDTTLQSVDYSVQTGGDDGQTMGRRGSVVTTQRQGTNASVHDNQTTASVVAAHSSGIGSDSSAMSSVVTVGADDMALNPSELVDLICVRGQTINTIIKKYQQMQFQNKVVTALAKKVVIDNQQKKEHHDNGEESQSPVGGQHGVTLTLSPEEEAAIASISKEDCAYLAVRVTEARWLTPGSLNNLSDCYAMITFNKQTYKTPIAKATLNPFWRTEILFKITGDLLNDIRRYSEGFGDALESAYDNPHQDVELPEPSALNRSPLRVAIFHHNRIIPDSFLGGVIISNLDSVLAQQVEHDERVRSPHLATLNKASDGVDQIFGSGGEPLSLTSSASSGDSINDDNANSSCPIFFVQRWFKLHALRQNKRLHGQVKLGIGFIDNELKKQMLLLYEMESSLLAHVALLARLTTKFQKQLQMIDAIGVVDLNSLSVYPVMNVTKALTPPEPLAKDTRPKYKEKLQKGDIATLLTMTVLGPLRIPQQDIVTAPSVDGVDMQPGQVTSTQHPLQVSQTQLKTLLSQVCEAVYKLHHEQTNMSKDIQVTMQLQDVQIDPQFVINQLLLNNRILPQWVPKKIVGVVQCNGHVSKVDLFDVSLPLAQQQQQLQALGQLAAATDVNNKEDPEPTISLDKPPSVDTTGVAESLLSSQINAAQQQQQQQQSQKQLTTSPLTDASHGIELDESNPIESLRITPKYGPSYGTITEKLSITFLDTDVVDITQESKDGKSTTTPPSSPREQSVVVSDSGAEKENIYREISLVPPGPSGVFTFILPLALVQSYVPYINNLYTTPPQEADGQPMVTITILCEVQREYNLQQGAASTQSNDVALSILQTDYVPLGDIDIPVVHLQYMDTYGMSLSDMEHAPPLEPKTAKSSRKKRGDATDGTTGDDVVDATDLEYYDETAATPEYDDLGRDIRHLHSGSYYYFVRPNNLPTGDVDNTTGKYRRRRYNQHYNSAWMRVPPSPLSLLTEKELAKKPYTTQNPHIHATYLYQQHLQAQLSDAASDEHIDGRDGIGRYTNVIDGVDPTIHHMLLKAPLSPIRIQVSALLQNAKPLVERPQMQATVQIPHFGLSLVDSSSGRSQELLYISTDNLFVEFVDSISQQAIEMKIEKVQIDQQIGLDSSSNNKIVGTTQDLDNIIFGPSWNGLQSGLPFIHVSVNKTKTVSSYPVQVFKYTSVLIQEFDVRVQEALIWHLLRFANDVLPPLTTGDLSDSWMHSALVCDYRVLYQPLDFTNTTLFYFTLLQLHPIALTLTVKVNPDVRSSSDDMKFNPVQTALSALTGILGSVDAAPIAIKSVTRQHIDGDVSTLVAPIIMDYITDGMSQVVKILGSVEFLGNPVSLISGLKGGVKDFFYEPAQGLVSSPKDFGTGLAKGSASLLKSVTSGVFGSASKITGSIGTGIAVLTADSQFQANRRARNNRQVKHAGQGILQGFRALSSGLYSGVTGIVLDPIQGARRNGVGGFFIGIGTGITGVVTKTAVGAVDMVSLTLKGIGNTFKMFEDEREQQRSRLPRFISPFNAMKTYDSIWALAAFTIKVVENPHSKNAVVNFLSGFVGSAGRNTTELQDELTMKDIMNCIDKKRISFFDTDLATMSAGTIGGENIDMVSVLREIEDLLADTLYFKRSPVQSKQWAQTMTNIKEKIDNRLRFISSFIPEDLVSCCVINDNKFIKQPLLIVVTTERLIIVDVKLTRRCAREGGVLNSYLGAVKLNVYLDRIVDVTADLVPRVKLNTTGAGTVKPSKIQHSCLMVSYVAKDSDVDTYTIRIPIIDQTECQSTALFLASVFARPTLVSAMYGTSRHNIDVTGILKSHFDQIPTTPYYISSATETSREFFLQLAKFTQNRDDNGLYTPTPQDVEAVWKHHRMKMRINQHKQHVIPFRPLRADRPLTHYPIHTYRQSPNVMVLRKPHKMSVSEWLDNLVGVGNPYKSKVLTVTYYQGSHVITKSFVLGDSVGLI